MFSKFLGYNTIYVLRLLVIRLTYVNGQTTIERIENEYWLIPSYSLPYQKDQSTLLIHYLPKSCSLLPFKISPIKKIPFFTLKGGCGGKLIATYNVNC